MRPTRPIGADLFREPDGDRPRPVMLGGKCRACQHISFPAAEVCGQCQSVETDLVELGDRAELICATRVHMATKNFQPGFVVGYVRLPHDVRIFAQLSPAVLDCPAGAPLRLTIDALWNSDGVDVRGYRFVVEDEVTSHA